MSIRRIGSLKGKTDFDIAARAVHAMQRPPKSYDNPELKTKPNPRPRRTRHQRIAARVEEVRATMDRLGTSGDIRSQIARSDVRIVEGVIAGIWMKCLPGFAGSPLRDARDWWCKLPWMQREAWIDGIAMWGGQLTILHVSTADEDQTNEEQAEFFKAALPNPRLEKIELRRKSLQQQSA